MAIFEKKVRCVTLIVLLFIALTITGAYASQPSQVAGCKVFVSDSIWNRNVDDSPINANSGVYIETIGSNDTVHADFDAGVWEGVPIGIPYVDVAGTTPAVDVISLYDDESDHGSYSVPSNAPIESGEASSGDRQVVVVDRDNCVLYEIYIVCKISDTSWHTGSGAINDLASHALRPYGWTSAEAAGLHILTSLVRYEEAFAGEICHAYDLPLIRCKGCVSAQPASMLRHLPAVNTRPWGSDSGSSPVSMSSGFLSRRGLFFKR